MGLHEALIKVQGSLKAPKDQTNTFGKYNYRSCEGILEAVKPLLKENALALHLSDAVEVIGDRVYIKATATITDGKEKREVTAYAREPVAKKGMDESQITGMASSYARKYALNGLLCIDDTKDADTNELATQQKNTPVDAIATNVNVSQVNAPVCSDCGCVIAGYGKHTAQDMAKTTKQRFGRVLCTACATEESARLKTQSA